MTATSSDRPDLLVRLRICNGDGERIVPASVLAVEQAFGAAIGAGAEFALTGGEMSLVAVALNTRDADAESEVLQFMLSRINGEHASLAGPLSRSEALQQFRQFVLTVLADTTHHNERVSP
jgi:hypothetical protein